MLLLCRQQFGQLGLRVTLRQLEQKQVAEKAMLPTKDTQELVYRMLKAGRVRCRSRTPATSPSAISVRARTGPTCRLE